MNVTEFKEKKDKLIERHSGARQGELFAVDYARLMDNHLEDLIREAAGGDKPSGLAVAALGGYGRGELAPYSDVDLLFLTGTPDDQKKFKGLIEKVLYPLWDLKLDVGHAVRTPAQGLDMARSDFPTLTTQLDGRFLAGDVALYAEFVERLYRYLGAKARKKVFIKDLKKLVTARHQKHGRSPYLLEPNVKEGQGGLRDIHAVYWTATGLYDFGDLEETVRRGLLPADRLKDLEKARTFMTDVRHHMHLLAGEKTDTLTFELQVDVARRLGYESGGHEAGVERFMREYYTHVYRTKNTLDYFLDRVEDDLMPSGIRRFTQRPRRVEKGLVILRGKVELESRVEVRRRPILMMRAHEISAASGLPLSYRALEMIRTNLDLVDDDFRSDPKVAECFLRAITAVPPKTGRKPGPLEATQDLDFLEAYLPELAKVRAQVQHDAYHVYTVDVHLMLTLRELKNVAMGLAGPEANGFDAQVLEQVEKKEILFLACLLHDVGKGSGRDHSRRGADMVPEIGRRLGLSEEDTQTLRFLVEKHLYIVDVAMRRDLSEEKLIVDVARNVGDVDRINMLYLLTVADSRATGPGVMNKWKLSLLRDLYAKVHRVLTHSDLAARELSRRTDQLLISVAKALEDKMPSAEVDAHLEKMSAHYLSVMTVEEVVKHILMERELGDQTVLVDVSDCAEGYCEVTIVTKDRPGLLSKLAGIFTLNHINILGAQVFTRANNVAMDIFQVDPPPDREYQAEAWERFKKDCERVLTGKIALEARLSKKQPLMGGTKTVTSKPDEVVIDNETSDFYTIVEVHTYDRLGLLHNLTGALFDLELSINIAKISTKVEQVVDVFYVRDFEGQKIYDKAHIGEIKEALLFALNR